MSQNCLTAVVIDKAAANSCRHTLSLSRVTPIITNIQNKSWITHRCLLSATVLCLLIYCNLLAASPLPEETVLTPTDTSEKLADVLNSTKNITRIIIPNESANAVSEANYYPENLLKLALQKTEFTDGRATVSYFDGSFGRERLRSLLRQDEGIDVLWSSSTPERDLELLPIKFNIMRGLNEYRVLLIRAEDKEKFAQIKTLDELRKYRAGTGIHWSDTLILKTNDIPYATSWAYEPLFKMLAAKRFDYMARGMQEIKHELVAHADLNLTIADKVMLHYHQPIYFYVSRKNPKLADRILRGLNLAEGDGSFDRLFFSIPEHREATEAIKNNSRLIFNLKRAE